jgi:hypothetical protein
LELENLKKQKEELLRRKEEKERQLLQLIPDNDVDALRHQKEVMIYLCTFLFIFNRRY